jgi:hypothetical protein
MTKPSEKKVTSKKEATKASRLLKSPKTPKKYRSNLASNLGQAFGKPGK